MRMLMIMRMINVAVVKFSVIIIISILLAFMEVT